MIKDVKTYTVICDNCGVDCNNDAEFSSWDDADFAKQCAMEDGWINDENNDYCPECFSYGDNDELLINLSRKNNFI